MMEKLDQPQTHIQLKNMMKALGVAADGGLDFSEVSEVDPEDNRQPG